MKHKNSNYTFSRVPSVVRPRSVFDRSRTYKTTFNAGKLIPFFWDEILPGDTIANLNVTSFARLTTPIVPFMDNLYMDFFFFFVPYRLVWDNWQRFCGEQDNPDDSTDYLLPQVQFSAVDCVAESLPDYFGLPLGFDLKVSSLPFRAYNLIWNCFFRDENLQNSVLNPTGDGPDDWQTITYEVLPRGKRKTDPFTSALPWPQKGPGVELPLGGYANVIGNGKSLGLTDGTYEFFTACSGNSLAIGQTLNSTVPWPDSGVTVSTSGTDNYHFAGNGTQKASLGVSEDPLKSGLVADLSSNTAITINALREAFQIQKWYEQLARGGSRYVELVLSMFGCHTGDARLQRPEYLGGGSTPIQIHSVAQTSSTDAISPQGNLAAYAVSGQSGIGFSKSFCEHGIVIGLVSVRGDYTYQQGIDRFWSRRTKFDFYWPAFAHLGEVGILNKEIYYQNDERAANHDNEVFGYQERWYEYRYGISKVTGKLHSGINGSLDCWHLAQYFSNLPVLNDEFIKENPPVSRVLAVQNEPQFLFDSVIKCRMARVMPTYSVPGLVDHF